MIDRLTNWADAHWIAPFAERSEEAEWLDDLTLGEEALRVSLLELIKVNTWTGGHWAAVSAVRAALAQVAQPPGTALRIVDAGCGSGDNLRAIARWARHNQLTLELTGVDANAHTLRLARELSATYPEISYRCLDVFGSEFRALGKDVVVSSLFCHHFSNTRLQAWIGGLRGTVSCVVLNDLQRHPLPAYLFRALCWALATSPMTLHDGLVSIRRSFRRDEWRKLLEPIVSGRYRIAWRWAFRYQVVIGL